MPSPTAWQVQLRLLGSYDGCMKAIRNAGQEETYLSKHQLTEQQWSFCPATRGPQFRDLDKPENNEDNQYNEYN